MSVPTVDLRADLIKIWKDGGFAELQLLNATAGNAGWVLTDSGDGTLVFAAPTGGNLDDVLAAGGALGADRSSDFATHKWTISNGQIVFAASTTGHPSFNVPIGVPPTSPVTGDIWHTSGHLFFRDGTTSYDLLNPIVPTPSWDATLAIGLNTTKTPTQTQITKGGGQHWWQWILKPDASDPIQPYGTFNSFLDDTFVDGSGNRDHVFNFISYNYPGTGITTVTDANWRFGVERYFTNSLGNLFEFHMPNITTTAATDVRLYSIYANRDNGSALHQWYGNTFSWYKVGFSSQSYLDHVIDTAGSVTLNMNATQGTGGTSGTGLNQLHINMTSPTGFTHGLVVHDGYYMILTSYYLGMNASEFQPVNYVKYHTSDLSPHSTYDVWHVLPDNASAHDGTFKFKDETFADIFTVGVSLAKLAPPLWVTTRVGIGLASAPATGALLQLAASTISFAEINFGVGVAPTSPVDGDMWLESNTNTGFKMRINGVTKTVSLI